MSNYPSNNNKAHILDIFTVHKKQFTICFFVILVPTEPFQNDISCKYRCNQSSL